MNLAAVAREIDERLAELPTLVAHYLGQGRKSVTVPCSVVPLPDVNFNQTYGRGMTRIPDWEIALLAGKVDDQNAFDRMGIYADGTGADSVIQALQSTPERPYTACDVVIVKSATFDVITWQGQDFQGVLFTIDVAGS
jgi:hypothetical protein